MELECTTDKDLVETNARKGKNDIVEYGEKMCSCIGNVTICRDIEKISVCMHMCAESGKLSPEISECSVIVFR